MHFVQSFLPELEGVHPVHAVHLADKKGAVEAFAVRHEQAAAQPAYAHAHEGEAAPAGAGSFLRRAVISHFVADKRHGQVGQVGQDDATQGRALRSGQIGTVFVFRAGQG